MLLKHLLHWIKERESIRLKRLELRKPPWTKDEILQTYRFCNVRRMDDKVSQWILKNWYEPNDGHPDMLFACALARFINKISSLELITPFIFHRGGPKYGSIGNVLREAKKKGPIFNGAYMVRGNDGIDKVECVINYYVKPLEKTFPYAYNDWKLQWSKIKESYGMGSFMAGQITADLRWAISGGLWKGKDTWAPLGPGSLRGINRVFKRPTVSPLSQEDFDHMFTKLMEALKGELPDSITSRLEAIDYQNCLCEYDKYCRVLFNEGKKPKQKYHYD